MRSKLQFIKRLTHKLPCFKPAHMQEAYRHPVIKTQMAELLKQIFKNYYF